VQASSASTTMVTDLASIHKAQEFSKEFMNLASRYPLQAVLTVSASVCWLAVSHEMINRQYQTKLRSGWPRCLARVGQKPMTIPRRRRSIACTPIAVSTQPCKEAPGELGHIEGPVETGPGQGQAEVEQPDRRRSRPHRREKGPTPWEAPGAFTATRRNKPRRNSTHLCADSTSLDRRSKQKALNFSRTQISCCFLGER